MQIDFLNNLFYHVKGIINTRVETYRSIEKTTFDFPPVGWKLQLSGEVWLCLSRNTDGGPDPVDSEELQPLGQQQAAGTSSCRTELQPRAVWWQSRFTSLQLGDYQDCKWCLDTPGSSAECQHLALGKGAFLHALFAFFYGLVRNLTSPQVSRSFLGTLSTLEINRTTRYSFCKSYRKEI